MPATKTRKKTTAQKQESARILRNREKGEALNAAFAARIKAQDPADPLTHDAMWNPLHPDYNQNPGTGTKVDGAWDNPEDHKAQALAAQEPIATVKARVAERTAEETDKEDRREEARLGLRRNKYAGDCELCGANVPADEGHINKRNGRWVVRHRIACPAVEAKPEAAPAPAPAGLDLSSLPSGRYADPQGDGRLKVKVDNVTKAGRWQGFIFVKDAAEYGAGRRYGMQRPGSRYSGSIEDTLQRIAADPEAAMARYGQLTGTCGACGRTLEDATSVELGIGPICRTKGLFG